MRRRSLRFPNRLPRWLSKILSVPSGKKNSGHLGLCQKLTCRPYSIDWIVCQTIISRKPRLAHGTPSKVAARTFPIDGHREISRITRFTLKTCRSSDMAMRLGTAGNHSSRQRTSLATPCCCHSAGQRKVGTSCTTPWAWRGPAVALHPSESGFVRLGKQDLASTAVKAKQHSGANAQCHRLWSMVTRHHAARRLLI